MYIEGRNAVLESLRSERIFKKLFVQDAVNKDEKVRQIISKAKNRGIHIQYVKKNFLDSHSVTGVHQGFIAQVEENSEINLGDYLNYVFDNKQDPFLIYIRDAQYSHNIGAIIRTAECAGAHGVILPPKVDVNADVIRASVGAAEHIKIFHESLFSTIKLCKKTGMKVVGIEVVGEKNYFKTDLTGATLLIIGGEDKSLSMEIIKKCDIIVKIPLLGKVNSLNMSVAAGIIIYDKVRQEAKN